MKSSVEECRCEGLSSASNGNESVQHSRAIRLGHEDGEGEPVEPAKTQTVAKLAPLQAARILCHNNMHIAIHTRLES